MKQAVRKQEIFFQVIKLLRGDPFRPLYHKYTEIK